MAALEGDTPGPARDVPVGLVHDEGAGRVTPEGEGWAVRIQVEGPVDGLDEDAGVAAAVMATLRA